MTHFGCFNWFLPHCGGWGRGCGCRSNCGWGGGYGGGWGGGCGGGFPTWFNQNGGFNSPGRF